MLPGGCLETDAFRRFILECVRKQADAQDDFVRSVRKYGSPVFGQEFTGLCLWPCLVRPRCRTDRPSRSTQPHKAKVGLAGCCSSSLQDGNFLHQRRQFGSFQTQVDAVTGLQGSTASQIIRKMEFMIQDLALGFLQIFNTFTTYPHPEHVRSHWNHLRLE